MDDKRKKDYFLRFLLIIVIILLLIHIYSSLLGKIEHKNYLVPTGNVDIFDINCKSNNSTCNDNTNPTFNEDNNLVVYDKYTIYGKEKLRIFENPAYQYESVIAPGSSNSYNFIIRNNNSFNINLNIKMVEKNDINITMVYRLKENNNYIIGDDSTWVKADKLKLDNISLNKKDYNTYILDWKWTYSTNSQNDKIDTKAGFLNTNNYSLSIIISSSEAENGNI